METSCRSCSRIWCGHRATSSTPLLIVIRRPAYADGSGVEHALNVLMHREKFIDGLPAARIGAIVVENHHAAGRQQRIDSVDADSDGIVPIAIDVGQSDRARRMQGLFEKTLY